MSTPPKCIITRKDATPNLCDGSGDDGTPPDALWHGPYPPNLYDGIKSHYIKTVQEIPENLGNSVVMCYWKIKSSGKVSRESWVLAFTKLRLALAYLRITWKMVGGGGAFLQLQIDIVWGALWRPGALPHPSAVLSSVLPVAGLREISRHVRLSVGC